MCGVAGILNINNPISPRNEHEISHLLKAQHHRGPDGSGTKQVSEKALLGSVRLRITDAENPQADMPLSSRCGRYTIVFNGEIYNHLELRNELTDYPFATRSDTETLLATYMKWGSDCLNKLEGMFAFCVHDKQDNQTFFAVDPSGQKFLYYLQDKDGLVFASEIQALITNPYRYKSWDIEGLREYVAQRMIIGEDTHIREIKKFEPGTCGYFKGNGDFKIQRYYNVPLGDQSRNDIEAIKQEISEAVRKACETTFELEVPYGHLLSGGIDSSIVTHHAKRKGLDLSTYSIGFDHFEGETFGIPSTFNEFDYSRYISDYLGTDHREIVIDPEEYCQLIDKWIAMMGEPLDSAEAPMLTKLFENCAKKHRVIFCGSGPDEAFDGYGLGFNLAGVNSELVSEAYYDKFSWFFGTDPDQLVLGHQDIRSRVIEKMNRFLAPYHLQTDDHIQLAQLINLHGRMAAYEFRQMDVISMNHSVEVRSPLADKRITKAAFDFDASLKNHQETPKWIYKEALRGQLPERIIDREKIGFPVPIEFWFSSAFQDRFREIQKQDSPLLTTGIINEDYARELWATRDLNVRSTDYRLYCLNKLMVEQKPYVEILPATN